MPATSEEAKNRKKERNRIRMRERYHNNEEVKQKTIEKSLQRYHNNDEVKQKTIKRASISKAEKRKNPEYKQEENAHLRLVRRRKRLEKSLNNMYGQFVSSVSEGTF